MTTTSTKPRYGPGSDLLGCTVVLDPAGPWGLPLTVAAVRTWCLDFPGSTGWCACDAPADAGPRLAAKYRGLRVRRATVVFVRLLCVELRVRVCGREVPPPPESEHDFAARLLSRSAGLT